MKLHRQAHVVYKTQYHIVWITRYRRKILVRGIKEYFEKSIKEVREFHPDWYIEEIGIEADHIHIHMIIPPKYAVSKVVEVIKSVTSKRLKEKFPHFLNKTYWDRGGVWARGFFVSTVGVNEITIRNYIKNQGQQDAGQAKLEL
jgi:putative transposase